MRALGLKNVYFYKVWSPLEPPKLDFYNVWELWGSEMLIFTRFETPGAPKAVFSNSFEAMGFKNVYFYKVSMSWRPKSVMLIRFGASGGSKKLMFLRAL